MTPAALRALAVAAEALARLAREAASEAERAEAGHDTLIPVAEAARLEATSLRVVRDAIRRGELAAFGRMRDRAVSHADLIAWIGARAFKPVDGIDDADIARRVRRLAEEKRTRTGTARAAKSPGRRSHEALASTQPVGGRFFVRRHTSRQPRYRIASRLHCASWTQMSRRGCGEASNGGSTATTRPISQLRGSHGPTQRPSRTGE